MKIDIKKIEERVKLIETHWDQDYMDYQEEARRIAILELALEELGQDVPHLLWGENNL
jgi:hypothetical protein